jgi:Domain of unknown function (DUF4926)
MPTLQELDTIVLLRDVPEAGLRAGDIGAVVIVPAPGVLQVEFVTAAGRTQALLTLSDLDVRLREDHDLLTSDFTPTIHNAG